VVGVGLDAVDIDRFRRSLERTPTMRSRVFTSTELHDVSRRHDPVPGLAARFAAREAAMKALGVGLGAFGFHDLWVTRAASGAPSLAVVGAAAELMRQRHVDALQVSLSHTDTLAQAIVVAVRHRDLRCESCNPS
jgi:holo-[acyl-carrier protein] synthase